MTTDLIRAAIAWRDDMRAETAYDSDVALMLAIDALPLDAVVVSAKLLLEAVEACERLSAEYQSRLNAALPGMGTIGVRMNQQMADAIASRLRAAAVAGGWAKP